MTATIDLHVPPMSCFRLVTRRFSTDQSLLKAILDGVGVEPDEVEDPDLEITYAQLMREFENLNRLVGERWLLEVRELWSATAHGALGLVVSTAPTVGAAAHAFARYLSVYTPYQQACLSRRPGGIVLRHTPTEPMSSGARRRIDEMLLLLMGEMIAGLLAGRRSEILFEHPWIEPAHGPQIEMALGAPVRWGAGTNAIVVPEGLLAVRSPLGDSILHQVAIERLEQTRRALAAPDALKIRLSRLLARSETGRPSIGQAANSLGLSQRTLTRRLAEGRLNYRDMVDAELKQRARRWLDLGTLSRAEIGERLGFSDAGSFGRALRRWFKVQA
jgi:AraC-like DNA-binding protein